MIKLNPKAVTIVKNIKNAVVANKFFEWLEFITTGKDVVEISHLIFHFCDTNHLNNGIEALQEGLMIMFL